MTNAVEHSSRRNSRVVGTSSYALVLVLCTLTFSSPTAAAEPVYPIKGVWVAIDERFPAAAGEVCLDVKTFGVESASRKAVTEVTIFSDDERYSVKESALTRSRVKAVKPTGHGFLITEMLGKPHRWLRFRRRVKYFIAVLDPRTIEIRDAKTTTRYRKCGPRRPAI
jgi:hypothetical protein